MKNFRNLVIFTAMGLVLGCGSSGSSGGNGTPPSSTITISGTLGIEASQNIGVMAAKETTPASDYAVVVLNNSSNKTYNTTTGSDGGFSVEVPSGSSYLISLVNDDDSSYAGPIVFDGSGETIYTAITPADNTALGEITLNTENGYARTETAPGSVNTAVTTYAAEGRPYGAASDGTLQNSEVTTLQENTDKDQDGIPNLFDADEDNDGYRNGIRVASSTTEVVSDYISDVYYSSNIWATHGEISTGDTQADIAAKEIALRLHVIPKTGQESRIGAVQCTVVPSGIASSATIRHASSLADDWPTHPLGYPAEHSPWSSDSYNLYNTIIGGLEQWIVSIKPGSPLNIGDTFTIRVTYTDTTYEDFFITLPYFMTDWPSITTYNDTDLGTDVGTRFAPITFNSDTLDLTFSKPLDENGAVLEGLTYTVGYGESDCSSGTCTVATNPSSIDVTDTVGATTLSCTVPTTTAQTYYIVPVAATADGQRNGEETWFTRE